TGIWFFIILAGRPIAGPTAAHAQADSSSAQRPGAEASFPDAARRDGLRKLYRLHCVKCHGENGTGSEARASLPRIPDFTDASWQARQSDAQLLASILDGKGKDMPPRRGKITEEQARGLVTYIKSFAPITGKSPQERQGGPALFNERYRRLQEY